MHVFLSYAKEDQAEAMRLKRAFERRGLKVWFDRDSLLGGENWRTTIADAIRSADYFIALLSSRSVGKRGYVQKEIRDAIDVLDQRPPNVPYLIPVRLDDCQPTHERLRDVQSVDLFPKWTPGVRKLFRRLVPSLSHAASGGSRAPIRTDGVYVARTQGAYRYHYLRFLRSHTVVGCPSSLSMIEIAPWLTGDNSDIAAGKYSVRKQRGHTTVTFPLARPEGVVDCRGYILPADTLVVRKHSHINGYRDIEEYRFVSVNPAVWAAQSNPPLQPPSAATARAHLKRR